jgi:bifunctional DNA-binding transcriptional regulator/antitoxin component of YhaV-PrlF toxin-antitoxin module
MAVVSVDERGRLSIPKELGIRTTRAILIPAGSFLVVVPIPKEPSESARGWLRTTKSRSELKTMAERLARREAVMRARRRKQA